MSHRCRRAALVLGLCLGLGLSAVSAEAVPILEDPNGYNGIAWGTILAEQDRFVKVEDAGRQQTYELKDTSPVLGTIPVDSVQFTTYWKKFGRVTIRYTGKETHQGILTYLQTKYGPLDRTPGQITVGPVKVYAWLGMDTEVTLRYEARFDRGIIFIESRMLPEKFSEGNSGTVF